MMAARRRPRRTIRALATLALVLFVAASEAAAAEPKVLNVWPGRAPGTEHWAYGEMVRRGSAGEILSYANVREPTLTLYLPDASRATGTGVLILPGGALRMLSWDAPAQTAEWLNRQGIAAFVLKYRTLQTPPTPPAPVSGGPGPRPFGPPLPTSLVIRNANANPAPEDKALDEVLHAGIADAEAAMRLIRRHAAEWRLDPSRVGMLGFSAGGGVAIGAALSPPSDAHPDFLISLYGPSLMDVTVPANAPPLFLAVGADHQPVANGLIALHSVWKAAGKPSELHVYDQVRGPFGFSGANSPVDGWPDHLLEWMKARKLVTPPASRDRSGAGGREP